MLCEEKGARAAGGADRRRRRAAARRVRAAARPAHAAGGGRARLQRAGHRQPGASGSSSWRTRAACRCWWTAPRRAPHLPVDVQRARTATSTRSPATSCTGRPASACSTARRELLEAMPPYQGGGDMILLRHLREDDLQRAALQVRGGHAEHRGRDRPGRGRSTTSTGSASTRSPRTSTTCSRYGTERLLEVPGLRLIGTAREKAARALLRARGRAPARHRHRPRLRGHRGAHRPPLRAAGDGALRRARHRARVARRSTTRARRSTRWCAGLHKVREMFALTPTCASSTRR